MSTQARIICIGNPFQPRDWVGPAMFATLRRTDTARGIEIVDGGLHGLNLLPLLEDVERVIFADTLVAQDDEAYRTPTVLQAPFEAGAPLSFDHAGGLAYLLQAAPLVLASLPAIWVVGASADAPRDVVDPLARICLQLARSAEHAPC